MIRIKNRQRIKSKEVNGAVHQQKDYKIPNLQENIRVLM